MNSSQGFPPRAVSLRLRCVPQSLYHPGHLRRTGGELPHQRPSIELEHHRHHPGGGPRRALRRPAQRRSRAQPGDRLRRQPALRAHAAGRPCRQLRRLPALALRRGDADSPAVRQQRGLHRRALERRRGHRADQPLCRRDHPRRLRRTLPHRPADRGMGLARRLPDPRRADPAHRRRHPRAAPLPILAGTRPHPETPLSIL